MDIEELIAAVRSGEAWVGPALVTLLLPMLTSYAAEIGSDLSESDREQAIEKAVLRAVDRVEKYDSSKASFATWVRGFLRFTVADARRNRQGRHDVPLDMAGEVADSPSDLGAGDTESALTWPLLQLSVTDQVIIALRDFEELPYEACARRIGEGVSAGACRVRHLRALKRLRQILDNDPEFQHFLEGDELS